MNVASAVGQALADHGVRDVFGVVGSGNFHVTNALVAAGARFHPAAHEGGAASMADGYARVSGRLTVLSVHQGPGVTNALTGIAEAAKGHTPLVVLAPEATSPHSNFHIDLPSLAASVGAGFRRVAASTVYTDVAWACTMARAGAGHTVVLGLPLDVQSQPAPPHPSTAAVSSTTVSSTTTVLTGTASTSHTTSVTISPAIVARVAAEAAPPPSTGTASLVDALAAARWPVFVAGRGAARRGPAARTAIAALADRRGALLAVSAAARGLFTGDP